MSIIHQVKISKKVSHTIGVELETPNLEKAVHNAMASYERSGYYVESVDGKPVHRCDGCKGLIFNGEGVKDTDGTLHCAKCLDVVQPEPNADYLPLETPAYVPVV